jgi:Zn-dependent peptidase ImmA (M78 family)
MFIDPGIEYLETNNVIQNQEDVLHYISYLCSKAGISHEPPVDIDKIYECFKIKCCTVSLGSEIQGISNPDSGLVFINDDDPIVRQRFTKGHELVEFLFSAQSKKIFIEDSRKESLCDFGAANLLIPERYVQNNINDLEINLSIASSISKVCNASFLASILQMVKHSKNPVIAVLCKKSNKPLEIKSKAKYSKKLRIKWVFRSSTNIPYIPKYKSISESSCIYKTYSSGKYSIAEEQLELSCFNKFCRIESDFFLINGEGHTISLIHIIPD